MASVLFPITRQSANEAVALAPELARLLHKDEDTVIVLQTECLHGLFTDVDEDALEMESRRILEATERVAEALRRQGLKVETVWECVQAPRRPVDPHTVRRLGADAVFVPRHGGLAGLFQALGLRRLRRHGIRVLRSVPVPVPAPS
ncbi:MAG: hypothetical protein C4290_09665 [Chloroflexota bacterium]